MSLHTRCGQPGSIFLTSLETIASKKIKQIVQND